MCIEAVQQKVLHRAFLGEDVDTHSRQGVEYQAQNDKDIASSEKVLDSA